MRHWSHHHSTDTVDDPVFRAAMRGFDAVSFVFGLEVTWSLIQQRQQEEEEKQALLELEAAQEFENEESTKDEETVGCSDEKNKNNEAEGREEDCRKKHECEPQDITMAAEDDGEDDEDDDDGTWNLSYTYRIDEIQSETPNLCTCDDCKNVACALWKSEKGEETKTCLTCLDEEFGGWPEGMEPQASDLNECIKTFCNQPPIDRGEIEHSDDSAKNDDIVNTAKSPEKYIENGLARESANAQQSNKSSSPKTWACSLCTFDNEKQKKKCGMCGNPKSPKKRKI